ncbi:MAG: T9SS type A sorting domain-containing protein [Flavobacteriales bacterium]
MKRTLLLAAFAAALNANAQTLVATSFENWTGTVPDGWSGSKTTFAPDSVQQATVNITYGSYAVRLVNNSTSHKRFTTQPQTVVDGTAYNISWYMRGQGQVRTGLFDGRPGGSSGYATYNSYVAAGASWVQSTQQVVAANDTVGAEFILSVLSSSGVGVVEIDSVRIWVGTVNPPTISSIYDIQYTTLPNGDSPLLGQQAITGGRVTATSATGYALQAGSGPWSGIFVFDTNAPDIGDSVTFTAAVQENFNMTQLMGVTGFAVVSSGNAIITDNISTLQGAGEEWEGCLVKVSNADCTVAPDAFGQWTVNDGTGAILVDDIWYPYTPAVGTNYDVTGIAWYSFAERKIEPRDVNDVSLANGISDVNAIVVDVLPNPASDALTVLLPNGVANYLLSDASGRMVNAGTFAQQRNAFDVSSLAPGVYDLLLTADGAVRNVRVVVQR